MTLHNVVDVSGKSLTAQHPDQNIARHQSVNKSLNAQHFLAFPESLFGRFSQQKRLLNAWKQAIKGKQIVSIAGPSGSGKTALVNSIGRHIRKKHFRFATGKFDQIHHHSPYGAITPAIDSVISWILSRNQKEFEQWKAKLASALKDDAWLLIDIFADLELIIGPQPVGSSLSPIEEKNRFSYLFKQFFQALTDPKYPLLLFIDDLQWADAASMELISTICHADAVHSILFVGAYRDKEITDDHPWLKLLRELEQKGFATAQLTLPPLKKIHINQFLNQTLNCSRQEATELSEALLKKTGGLPMDIRQMLLSLEDSKLLSYVADTSCWQWNMTGINQLPADKNAAELIARRIQRLDTRVVDILLTAACMGSHFNLAKLGCYYELDIASLNDAINTAERAGIVIEIVSEQYDKSELAGHTAKTYAFAHDSIHKQLLHSIPEQQRRKRSGQIGVKLLAGLTSRSPTNDLLLVTSLLNFVPDTSRSPRHCLHYAKLNWRSGRIALQRAAYEPALAYFCKGIELLGQHVNPEEVKHASDPELLLRLYQGAAQAAFFTGRFEQMNRYIDYADHLVDEPLKKIKLYETRVCSLYARNMMDEAIDVALAFSHQLGVRIKKHPGKGDIILGLIKTHFLLRKKSVSDLAALPKMTDPKMLAALHILSCVTLSSFYARPELLPLIIFKSIELSLKYGNTDISAFGYAGYGFVLCGVLRKIDRGHQFGQLAYALLKKYQLKNMASRTKITVEGFINHWKKPVSQTLPVMLNAYKTGLETGDHQFAAISAAAYCSFSFHCGVQLQELQIKMNNFAESLKELKQDVALSDLNICRQSVLNLTTLNPEPWILKGPLHHLESDTPSLQQTHNHFGLFNQTYLSMYLCLLFNRYREAARFSHKALKLYDAAIALPESYNYLFYDSLIRLSLLPNSVERTRKKALRHIIKNQKKLAGWLHCNPVNIQHKYDLVQGLLHAHFLAHDKAEHNFAKAMTGARQADYLNDQALVAETIGRYYLSREDTEAARHYLCQAYRLYFKWGAVAKTSAIKRNYPPFTLNETSPAQPEYTKQRVINERRVDARELYAVLNASQSIANETRLSNVMTQLIECILDNSGCNKAVICFVDAGELKLQGMVTAMPKVTQILQNTPLTGQPTFAPQTILNYVQHSQQSIILGNAFQSEIFQIDPYITARPCLSVLCTPIITRNRVTGILYLENDQIENAFSEKHFRIVDILLSQAIVSIENSKLYESLHQEKEQKDAAHHEINAHKKLLRNMSTELAMVEERERKAIADDLHDSVTQTLALSILKLKKLGTSLASKQQKEIDTIIHQLDQTMTGVRSLTFQISPKILYDFGLVAALEWLADDIETRYGIEVSLINDINKQETLAHLSETATVTLYRAIRELLINVCKHAQTGLAIVQIGNTDTTLTIIVKDHGRGFGTVNRKRQGFGLISLQEHLQALGGNMRIDFVENAGSKVTISLPLKENQEHNDEAI